MMKLLPTSAGARILALVRPLGEAWLGIGKVFRTVLCNGGL